MNFGEALEGLKQGKKVARSGWNGKGMFLWLYKGVYSEDCNGNKAQGNGLPLQQESVPEKFWETPLQPFILMKTADSTYVPWLASQTDVLAEDWEVVE